MHLTPSIQAYLDADTYGDAQALLQTFTPDAVVVDEGRTHVGREAIAAWWRDTKARYQHAITPLELLERGDVTRLRASVTGRFPGSPATLTFDFRVERERIVRLEVGA